VKNIAVFRTAPSAVNIDPLREAVADWFAIEALRPSDLGARVSAKTQSGTRTKMFRVVKTYLHTTGEFYGSATPSTYGFRHRPARDGALSGDAYASHAVRNATPEVTVDFILGLFTNIALHLSRDPASAKEVPQLCLTTPCVASTAGFPATLTVPTVRLQSPYHPASAPRSKYAASSTVRGLVIVGNLSIAVAAATKLVRDHIDAYNTWVAENAQTLLEAVTRTIEKQTGEIKRATPVALRYGFNYRPTPTQVRRAGAYLLRHASTIATLWDTSQSWPDYPAPTEEEVAAHIAERAEENAT